MKKLFGLYKPTGRLIGVYETDFDAWSVALTYQTDDFQRTYWKRVEPSRRAMRKLGWCVMPGRFVAVLK